MGNKYKPVRIEPDAIFSNIMVAKLINHIMQGGKKNTARNIVYGSFEIIKQQTNKEPIDIFETALKNVMPQIEVR
ncbi:MAG: 30S ribosomal protein S7, partial [Candidatus Gribaldobacteria bacterium]|nr:30S ribosomal protein S7 [Candidatus Gribaldobacteria bacterium]